MYIHVNLDSRERSPGLSLYLGFRLTELCGFLQCDEKRKETMREFPMMHR